MLSMWLLVALVVPCVALVLWVRSKVATATPVGKQPPLVSGPIPFIGAGLSWIRAPRAFLDETRARVGDVFVLQYEGTLRRLCTGLTLVAPSAFGLKLFFVFSPQGLADFYRVPETDGSFTEATRGFLGFKVPEEILTGSMATISKVLQRDFQQLWARIFADTVDEALDALGEEGLLDVFRWTKGLAHKAGLRAWVGEEAVAPGVFEEMCAAVMLAGTGFVSHSLSLSAALLSSTPSTPSRASRPWARC